MSVDRGRDRSHKESVDSSRKRSHKGSVDSSRKRSHKGSVGSGRRKSHKGSESNKECEYWSTGLEVDESDKGWAKCEKNPGHENFIPVGDFGLEHLPSEWQREDVVKLIKVHSDLTVRLRVAIESSTGPGGGPRVGTGLVRSVDPTPGHCAGQTDQRSWTFAIETAKHVVDDDSDYKWIRIDFYHDDDSSSRMKTLKGVSVVETRDKRDWRRFECLCYDEELAVQMMDQLRERWRLMDSLWEWFGSLSPLPAICVSHPHGRPKCVTVGERRGYGSDRGMFTYTTDTCPGSSGSRMVGWWWWGPHHCQGGEEGLNEGFESWR